MSVFFKCNCDACNKCATKKRKSKTVERELYNKNCLALAPLNQNLKITSFDQLMPYKIKRRILELGFVKESIVKISHVSMLGEVLLVEINGYLMSLRSDIAKYILVEKL